MNRTVLVICCVLLLLLGVVGFYAYPFLQAQPKVEKIGERLDKLDDFLGELKSERDERKAEEARVKAELEKKKLAEEARLKAEAEKEKAEKARLKAEAEKKDLAEAKRIVEEARRIKAEAEAKRIEEARLKAEQEAEEDRKMQEEATKKKLQEAAELEKKKAAEKRASEDLIKGLQTELSKVKKELEDARKKPTDLAPTVPLTKPPLRPPTITESRSFGSTGSSFTPTQPQPQPNPKTSSVRLENETDEIAKVKINDSLVDVEARKVKFVTVPAGQFTYQVLGVHEKPILSELNEGQVYGLAIRNAPKSVKQDTKKEDKKELPKPPPVPPDEEIPQKSVGGSVRLLNKNSIMIPFSLNGKTYRVEPGQEILVKVPVGRCVVGLPGMTSQTWSYEIVEGTTLRLGCNLASAPVQGYYYPIQGFYPSCGFR